MNAIQRPAPALPTIDHTRAFLSKPQRMLIDGEWVSAESGETIESQDPATETIIAHLPSGAAPDIDRAVKAARRALETGPWPAMTAEGRGEMLWRLADLVAATATELAALETYDNGAPVALTSHMMRSAVSAIRFYAGMATKIFGHTSEISGGGQEFHAYTRAEPVGVVGVITPWNGPLATLCNKVSPALAAGCTVVAKPAELTSLTALRFGELAVEAGVPAGVLNIVTGLGTKAGKALAEHPDVDKISFTGSTTTGRGLIHAASGNFKRLTLELGGKSPLIIFDDADLDEAIPAAARAIFMNSGQVCFAGSRLYVHRKIFEPVVSGIAAIGREMKLGNGFDPSTQLGPLVSKTQQARVLAYIADGVSCGADLRTGGGGAGTPGYYVEPTVFANVKADARIAQEEIFGPVLVATPFDDLDDVIKVANATPYGLGSGLFTRDLSRAHRVARRLKAGNVWINCYGVLNASMPFGGYKESGWGREYGPEGLEPFIEKKAVYARL